MPLPNSTTGREHNKFIQSPTRADGSAIEVVGSFESSPGPFSPPQETDFILRELSGSVETYTYKSGESSGTVLKTIEVTYTDSSLEDIISVEVL